MNKTKTNRGITLVALVITIIVLIILAGVSINAVMNDGLIENSKQARNEYEIGKQNELNVLEILEEKAGTATPEMEIQYYTKIAKKEIPGALTTNNSPCIYTTVNDEKEAYLTGLETEDDIMTAQDLYGSLNGLEATYEVWDENNTAKVSDDDYIATGMILKRNGKQVARLVYYGDIIGNTEIDNNDMQTIARYIEGLIQVENYQKIAMDVNHDGVINEDDKQFLAYAILGTDWPTQNVAAPDPDELTVELITE